MTSHWPSHQEIINFQFPAVTCQDDFSLRWVSVCVWAESADCQWRVARHPAAAQHPARADCSSCIKMTLDKYGIWNAQVLLLCQAEPSHKCSQCPARMMRLFAAPENAVKQIPSAFTIPSFNIHKGESMELAWHPSKCPIPVKMNFIPGLLFLV